MQEEKLAFSKCTMVDQELFFVETQNGLPAKMNPGNGDVSFCNIMENFILKAGNRIDYIRAFGDRVYALEVSGEGLIIFDLEKSQCQYIPLQCAYHRWGNFVAFEQYGSEFYIFPRYENKIYIVNIISNEISEVVDYFDGISELQCSCRVGDKVWLLPCDISVIGSYDLTNGKMQVYNLKKKIENCVDAVSRAGVVYLLNRFGIIYVWNTHELKLDEIKVFGTEYFGEKSKYGKIVYAGNKLIILPSLAEEIKILDMLTGSVETYHDYPEDFLYYDMEYMTGWSKYAGLCEDNNNYYCAMRRANYLLKISKQDGELLWVKPNMPSKKERMKIQKPLEEERFKISFEAGERFFLETDVSIGRFLKAVPRKEYTMERTNAGNIIWGKMKE